MRGSISPSQSRRYDPESDDKRAYVRLDWFDRRAREIKKWNPIQDRVSGENRARWEEKEEEETEKGSGP